MKQIFLILIISLPAISCIAQDWNLDRCLSYAVRNNKDLISHKYDISISREERISNQSKLLPVIDVNASLEYYWKVPVQTLPGELIGRENDTFITVPTSTNYSGNYSLNIHLNMINVELWSNIRLKLLKEQASKIEQKSIERLLRRNVKMAYYVAQYYTKNVNSAERRYKSFEYIHRLIEKLYSDGVIDKIEYNQSLSLLKNQESFLLETNNIFNSSMLDLKFWMGYPADSLLTISTQDDLESPDIPSFEVSLLPDYELKKARINIVKAEHKNALAALYPKLSLIGSYGQLGFDNDINFITKASSWHTSSYVGIQFSMPIFSISNLIKSRVKKIAYNQEKFKFSHYEDEQRKEYIKEAMLLYTNWKVYNLQNEKLKLAEENAKLGKNKIEKGIIDMLQLKQIQQDLFEEQEKFDKAIIKYLKSYVQITYLQKN